MMGITMILLLVYLVVFIIDGFALVLGLKQKKWILFVVISSIIFISIIALGYLWVKLPDENIPDGLTSEYEWNKKVNNQDISNTLSDNDTVPENNINISVDDKSQNEQTNQSEIKEEKNKVENIKIKVNNEVLNVKLEQNSSTEALVEKLKQGDITVNTREYGSFERVGSLGFSLPREDTQITTKAGDLMLYQGNQITLFYGTNSWSYTKLGEVIGKSENELKNILGSDDVTLILSIN